MGRQISWARSPSKPKPQYRKLIEETRRLIRGKRVKTELPDFGVSANARIWWKSDNHVELDMEDIIVRPLPGADPAVKKLLKKLRRDIPLVDALEGDILKAFQRSEEFQSLDTRVKAVCVESDRLEKEDEDFIWESDILDWADE